MLYLVHQGTYIIGHRIHTQCVQTTIEHVGLDAHLVKRFTECAHGIVRILTGHQVHLLEGTTVSLNATKAAHINDYRSDALQLILTWLELT